MWYAIIVAVLSLAGATVPVLSRPNHAQLQVYLSLSAGALLGAALFHLLPEASEHIHGAFGLPVVLGIAIVFFLQRYLAPHSHEPSSGHGHHGHEHNQGRGHTHDNEHHHEPSDTATERRAKTGTLAGALVAIFSLAIHSLFDGIAIGAAAAGANQTGGSLVLAVFLSVLIHKPMDGLSVSILLIHAGTRPRTLWPIQIAYAAFVPAGALLFQTAQASISDVATFSGYTLAFSAGTFLAIALTDLLPELHFHRHDRHKLSAALIAGLFVMWATSQIGHGHNEPESSPSESSHEDHQH